MNDSDFVAIGIVIVSDRANAGTYRDISGPAIEEFLREVVTTPWRAVRRLVPDGIESVRDALIDLADRERCALIFTTGGTGLAARDVTPEATLQVCEKVIPGFGEIMRAASLQKTAMAPLSRAQAATRGTALIVNLPGSESGARENLQAVLHLIPHALQLLEGKTEHS